MDPNVAAIAELFAIPTEEPPNSGRVGRSAIESRGLGEASLNDGRYTEALEHFRRALAQNPDDPKKALIDLAEAHAYGDDEPAALRLYRQAKVAGASEIGAADLYKRFGRYSDALEEIGKAIEVEPTNPYHRKKRAETLREAGFPREALKAATELVALSPESSYAHFLVAELHLKLDHAQEAIESYRAAIELAPGDDHLLHRVSVAFWRANRRPEAIKAIRLAGDLEPEKAVYHGLLQHLLGETGDHEGAALEDERAGEMDRYDRDTLARTLTEMRL